MKKKFYIYIGITYTILLFISTSASLSSMEINNSDIDPEAIEALLSLRRSANAPYLNFDINLKDNHGKTALHNAALAGDVEKVKLLCKMKAYIAPVVFSDISNLILANAHNARGQMYLTIYEILLNAQN